MPKRNPVPSLKVLCLRKVAWPHALFKRSEEKALEKANRKLLHPEPCLHLLVCKKYEFDKKGKNIIIPSIESIVNAWIQLSNYYGTNLRDIRQISSFLSFKVVFTLNFLHEGMYLRSGVDISEFAGLLPYMIQPQPMDPPTWKEIATIFRKLGTNKTVKILYIIFKAPLNFGPAQTDDEETQEKDRERAQRHPSKYPHPKPHPGDPFAFNETFAFTQLRKLVVRGGATDYLMESLGINCNCLQYLDIASPLNIVTEMGIVMLLLQRTTDKSFVENLPDTQMTPEYLIRPLTKTLTYLDISTIQDDGVLGLDDWLVTRVCPQFTICGTRIFIKIPGHLRSIARLKMRAMTDREIQKCVSKIRSIYEEQILNLTRDFRNSLMFGFTEIRNRAKSDQDDSPETSVEFYQSDRLAIQFTIENRVFHKLTTFHSSTLDFINLSLLEMYTPSLRHIKASLCGFIMAYDGLPNLISICAPVLETKETLFSLLSMIPSLEYMEAREILRAPTPLDDDDVRRIFVDRSPNNLEILRLLFQTDISLNIGVRGIFLCFKKLRILGDLSKWDVVRSELDILIENLSKHNFDIIIEYGTQMLRTRTQCQEFYN